MTEPVKNKRRYDSQLRTRQAQQTQEAVLASARRLFTKQGWSRTTIAAIAGDAGVSVETIYAVFKNKAAILRLLIQEAVRGDAPDVPLLQQAALGRLADLSDQREQIRQFAGSICAILERVAPLIAVARSAAESDPGLRPLYQQLHEGRRRNLMTFAAEVLLASGPLRREMNIGEATDYMFRIASPELFILMRQVEGRDLEAIAAWLEEVLARLLLDQGF